MRLLILIFVVSLLIYGIWFMYTSHNSPLKSNPIQSCVSACGLPSSLDFSGRTFPIQKTDADWRKQLGDIAFQVTRKHGTEPPFQNPYYNLKDMGLYACVCCEAPLFSSEDKFDSGTGWPSFTQPIDQRIIDEQVDTSFSMQRVEVHCTICGAHLGHVFTDGPEPHKLRYCINSASLDFKATATHEQLSDAILEWYQEH